MATAELQKHIMSACRDIPLGARLHSEPCGHQQCHG